MNKLSFFPASSPPCPPYLQKHTNINPRALLAIPATPPHASKTTTFPTSIPRRIVGKIAAVSLSFSLLFQRGVMDSSLREPTRISSREKRLRRVILPAIRGQNCPICLVAVEARSAAVLSSCNHAYCVRCIWKWSNLRRKCPLCNADFDSWFSQISLSSRSFHKELLPPLNRTSSARSFGLQHEEHPPRHVRSSERRRSRPLPWRRSFGRPGSVGPDTVGERKLQWRASVYDRRLQAVPSASRNCLQVSVPINNGVKERILQRIEPWIRRELQALLGDGDPSIIVHVATSLFIASLENKDQVLPGQCDVQGDPLASLRPFLVDRTDMFWHELRCFAESPFNMETYDAVVEYKSLR